MKTAESGLLAEAAVAGSLERESFKILSRNWKTTVCEIDIVARKNDVVYFVEVKYRANPEFGSGFEYIGPQKLKKLIFAAKVWCQHHRYNGDYRILAAEVSGDEYQSISTVEISV